MISLPIRLILVALAAAIGAAAAGFVGYVLLLPNFLQRTSTTIIEPRWLLPSTLCFTLMLCSFVAQRVLARGSERDGQLASSLALGVLIGVLSNLAWSARLLMTNASIADIIQAWAFMPIAAALGGALLGRLLGKKARRAGG